VHDCPIATDEVHDAVAPTQVPEVAHHFTPEFDAEVHLAQVSRQPVAAVALVEVHVPGSVATQLPMPALFA